MKGSSGIVFFVVILSLSALTVAERCSVKHKNYANIKEEFFNVLKDAVNSSIVGSENRTVLMTELKEKSNEFLDVRNKTCADGKLPDTWNYTVFLELVEFALRNVTILKDLDDEGMFQCIELHRSSIVNCSAAADVASKVNVTHYGRLVRNGELKFSQTSCQQTKIIKNCTLEILKENCSSAVDYVDSLFSFVLSPTYCNITTTVNSSSPHRLTGFWSTFTMFTLLTGLKMFNF